MNRVMFQRTSSRTKGDGFRMAPASRSDQTDACTSRSPMYEGWPTAHTGTIGPTGWYRWKANTRMGYRTVNGDSITGKMVPCGRFSSSSVVEKSLTGTSFFGQRSLRNNQEAPNKSLQRTGHANEGCSSFGVPPRVSRPLSCGDYEAVVLSSVAWAVFSPGAVRGLAPQPGGVTALPPPGSSPPRPGASRDALDYPGSGPHARAGGAGPPVRSAAPPIRSAALR